MVSTAEKGIEAAADVAQDLREELTELLGIRAGRCDAWPTLYADRNVFHADIVNLGRVPVDTARRLLVILRAYRESCDR